MPTLPAVIVTLLLPFEHLFYPRDLAQGPTLGGRSATAQSDCVNFRGREC